VDIPEVHPDFVDDKRLNDIEKEYASMVKMLDDHVGLIMAKLKEHGLDKKTVVIFTADNGHETYYLHNGKGPTRQRGYHSELDVFKGSMDLAGAKWTNWQGGIRVPLIVRWPDKIKAGSQSERLTAAYDYLPTIADLAGAKTPEGKDGLTILPVLLGDQQAEREFIMVNNAIISRGWKLVKHKKETLLFNLSEDPGERTDLAAKFPEKLARLQAIYDREKGSARRDL
jgi:arylsulfatase A